MTTQPALIQHEGEPRSNDIRRRVAEVEPACLRTFTPSLAVIAKSAGSYHWTPDGRKLADFTSGVLVANLGHNPVRWWKRVMRYLGLDQLDAPGPGGEYKAIAPLTAYNAITELETKASERLIASLRSQKGGSRCEQVLWAASGSEAIQKALWASLDFHDASVAGKDKIILATRRGFHGKKGLAGAVTGTEQDSERDPRVRFLSFPMEECRNVARRREPLDLTTYRNELAGLHQEFGNRLSTLITEPYLGGGGSFHPQPEYLQLLQSFCREHNLVFILDEVQANFGRTGELYAFTYYGLEPDIVVLGKGLGNGVAVSAAAGRRDLFSAMHYGEGSDTWSANPLSSAAVLATLDEFESSDVIAQAQALGKVLEQGLARLTETKVVTHVRGEAGVWGIECGQIGKHSPEEVAVEVVRTCYKGDSKGRAVHLLGALAGKVLRVSPPLTMPLDEAKTYLDVMYDLCSDVAKRMS